VSTCEEVRHCLCEVPQRLLLYHLAADPQPAELGTGLSELPALIQIARRALPADPPMRLLFDSEVPRKSGMRAMIPQHCLLDGGGRQTVTRHSNIVSKAPDISEEVKRRFLTGLNSGVSTPQS
jgi:hypothetical protein